MRKEVGTSGQISLGRRYAGQVFELQTRADGSIILQPVTVEEVSGTAAWAKEHAGQIDQYSAWVTQRKPYVRRWRGRDS